MTLTVWNSYNTIHTVIPVIWWWSLPLIVVFFGNTKNSFPRFLRARGNQVYQNVCWYQKIIVDPSNFIHLICFMFCFIVFQMLKPQKDVNTSYSTKQNASNRVDSTWCCAFLYSRWRYASFSCLCVTEEEIKKRLNHRRRHSCFRSVHLTEFSLKLVVNHRHHQGGDTLFLRWETTWRSSQPTGTRWEKLFIGQFNWGFTVRKPPQLTLALLP